MSLALRRRASTAWHWLLDEWRWFTAGVGLAVGLGFGWWAGSISSCASEGCGFSLEVFGVVGTWLGGVGTIVALAATAVALKSDLDARDAAAQREERNRVRREKAEQRDADRVEIAAARPTHSDHRYVYEIGITVRNDTAKTTAYKLNLRIDNPSWDFSEHAALLGAHSHDFRASLGGPYDPGRALPHDGIAGRLREITKSATLTFEMHDQTWTKRYGQRAQRVDDPD